MTEITVRLADDQLDAIAERVAARISKPEPESDSDRLISINEVCDRLNVGRTTVYEMRKRGELEAVQIGRAVRFREEDVEALRHAGAESAR